MPPTQQHQQALPSLLIHQTQQQHLDDTDVYASVWHDAIAAQHPHKHPQTVTDAASSKVKWGGRGQGGRGIARRTVQPNDVCIPDGVRLEYVGSNTHRSNDSSSSTAPLLLLENARLNLLSGHVYGMIGANGCGKSSLLRRIASSKIPGFPIHITTLLIQSHRSCSEQSQMSSSSSSSSITTLQYLMQRYHEYCTDHVNAANQSRIQHLEEAMEQLDFNEATTDGRNVAETIDGYMEEIASYEDMIADHDTMMSDDSIQYLSTAAVDAMAFLGLPNELNDLPFHQLTIGQQSKVVLALILLCCMTSYCDLLLIDEITSTLDIYGLIQLRRIIHIITSRSGTISIDNSRYDTPFVRSYLSNIHRKPTTILLVSHDNDFLNDVATDIIEFHIIEKKLNYYHGNYNQYLVQRQQKEESQMHLVETLHKKDTMMQQALNNIRNQPVHTSRGAKKKAKTINCQKKRIDKLHETCQSVDTETVQYLLRRKKYENEPDKAVQFNIRNCTSHWNEPLIVAVDVGHIFYRNRQRYVSNTLTPQLSTMSSNSPATDGNLSKGKDVGTTTKTPTNQLLITCKDGYLFDSIDLCINEGGVYCIVGESGCGKSTLLQILSKQLSPTEGTIHCAHGTNAVFIDFSAPSISTAMDVTTLQYLMKEHPSKTEHEVRSELTSFGLGKKQTQTMIGFLSGGEQCRLSMASALLRNPNVDVLCLDNPTANLDVESVDALIYGLKKWNGTIIMSCHDSYFVRSFQNDVHCYVLTGQREGKLRYVNGGMDEYIRSFSKTS